MNKKIRSVVTTTVFISSTLFIVLIITSFLLEGFIRIYASKVHIFDLEEWKYAKFLKRKSDNAKIGHEHVPNKSMILQGVNVSINDLGFRGRKYSLQCPDNTIRILFLGDSMTFGWGAPFDSVFSQILEGRLNALYRGDPAVEVINAGVGNYNTVMEVESFKQKGLRLSPRIVLLNYFINDAEPTPERSNSIFLNTPFYLPVIIWSRTHKLLASFKKTSSYEEYYTNLYRDDYPGWLSAQRALQEFFALCRESKIIALVSIIPELHDLSDNYPFAEIHEKIRKICDRGGVPCFDLFPYFRGKMARELWASTGDAHLNCKGHAIIADALYPQFKNVIDQLLSTKQSNLHTRISVGRDRPQTSEGSSRAESGQH